MIRFLLKSAVFCCVLSPGISLAEECLSFNYDYKTETEWNLLAGSAATNAVTVYEGPHATPGARYGAVRWTDNSGNLWLFGGAGRGQTENSWGYLSDLWKYDTTTGKWTFVSGNKTLQAVHGTTPAARWSASGWKDNSGNLYLFGGLNFRNEALNDLWKYDITGGSWELVAGSTAPNQLGVYSGGSSLRPGARWGAASWTDNLGNLWMFGGGGYGQFSNIRGVLSDLWKFDPIQKKWFVLSGVSGNLNMPGLYNSLDQYPGARYYSASWSDNEGNFWLFGGSGFGEYGGEGRLNDLWKYEVDTNTWDHINGSNITNRYGSYSGATQPGGRLQPSFSTDRNGNFWLYGGSGYGISGVRGSLSDLWRYDKELNTWVFVNGEQLPNTATLIENQNIVAGSRDYANSWSDKDGFLWLFGGSYLDQGRNDLLRVSLFEDSFDIVTNEDTPNSKTIDAVSDANGHGIISVASQPSNGIVTSDPATTNSLIYTPRPNFNGNDQFVIELKDFTGACTSVSTNTVFVRVNPVEDCPQFSNNGIDPLYIMKWQWHGGNPEINQPSSYHGENPSPGARYGAVRWTDNDGNLWLFGGTGRGETGNSWGYLNDLWKFDTTQNRWSFVSGTNILNSSNGILPASRWASTGWMVDNKLYLYGGLTNTNNTLSDLWEYDISQNKWSLIDGTFNLDRQSNYNSSTARPGGRWGATSWTDGDGNLWLHGGTGYPALNLRGLLADLWKFDRQLKTWTYYPNASSSYDSRPVYTGSQKPGGRSYSSAITDSQNNVWLFGGEGFSETSSRGRKNDLWKFSPSTVTWTYIAGNKTVNNPGNYTADPLPGARMHSGLVADDLNNLWLFGGTGFGASPGVGGLNDLWKFDTTLNRWEFSNGSTQINNTGNFNGTDLSPASRGYHALWTNQTGRLWIFGGTHMATTDVRNDMWSINPLSLQMTADSNGVGRLTINNVYDPDGIGIFEVVQAAQHGIVSVDNESTNSLTYVPSVNYLGYDSFVIALKGGSSQCEPIQLRVNVSVVEVPPVIGVGDVYINTPINTNQVIEFPITSELTDGYFITYIVNPPINGTLAFSSYNRVVYIPNNNFAGLDQFSYKVVNGSHESSTAVVSILVGGGATSGVEDWNIY